VEIQGLSVFRERLVIPMPCVVDKRRECILEREKKNDVNNFFFLVLLWSLQTEVWFFIFLLL